MQKNDGQKKYKNVVKSMSNQKATTTTATTTTTKKKQNKWFLHFWVEH